MFETMQQNIIKNVRTKAINNLISNEENKMSEQMVTTQRNENRRHSGVVGGAILISIGLFTLIQQFVQIHWGLYFLPFLALIFLVAGIVGRRPGLLIPGGILAGIGAGPAGRPARPPVPDCLWVLLASHPDRRRPLPDPAPQRRSTIKHPPCPLPMLRIGRGRKSF